MAQLQQVSFSSPQAYDYAADQAEVVRRQKMAEQLAQQAAQPIPANRMAGRFVVPVSPWEGMAKIAEGAASGIQEARADVKQRELAKRMQDDAMRWYGEQPVAGPRALPTDQEGTGSFDMAGVNTPQAIGQPTQQERMAWLLRGQSNPLTAPMAAAMFSKQLQGPNDMLAKINPKDYTPQSFQAFMQSGNPGVLQAVQEYATVGNSLVPKPVGGQVPAGGIQPVYTAPDKDEAAKFNAILKGAGIDPASPQGQALFKSLAMKTATHQPPTQVVTNVSTERKYGEQFAGQIAKADSDMRDAAIKAPQLAERSNEIRKILSTGNAITGTGAEFRLQFAKAAQLAGLGDGSATATEQVAASLAQNTLDAIKASGLGSGSGFSNADRTFLEKAVGGLITFERGSLERLAELSHRAAAKSAERWNTRVKEIPSTALEGTGIKADPIKVPGLFGSQPIFASNPQTGERIMSEDGGQTWRPAK